MQSFVLPFIYSVKQKTVMQQRHKDRQRYFNELANTSRSFYINYVKQFIPLGPDTLVLEIGCGEGGNLLPFAELGCRVTGIDQAASRISQAHTFFSATGCEGTFITTDFFIFSPPSRYHLILIHDVIEHIEEKEGFFRRLRPLLADGGIIFWRFPAWQMPFGGHQQICRNALVSALPFIHLLPTPLYRSLLRSFHETPSCTKELLEIKHCQMTIELFEKLSKENNYVIANRQLWFINPHYQQKFHLRPRKLFPFLARIKYIRNFFSTSCFYVTRVSPLPNQLP